MVNQEAMKSNYLVYKKWRKGGFASFTLWAAADKVVIDIGSFNEKTGGIISSTKCFIDADEFLAYLHAEVTGTTQVAYPSLSVSGDRHGLLWFGGTSQARVFKVEDWNYKNGSSWEPSSTRRFKCGLFEKLEGAQGTAPNYKKQISADLIQMKGVEIAILYQQLLSHRTAYMSAAIIDGSLKSIVKYTPDSNE